MSLEEILDSSLVDVSQRLRGREISPVELAQATLERMERLNPTLRAIATPTAERALAAARAAEEEIGAGRWKGPLHGIPFTVKDLFDASGVPTTAGSRLLRDAKPSRRDSAVVARLEAAGAVLLGKANLHEFAFGTTSDSTVFGAVRNPWDPSRIAGGSSGGSAAGVCAGLGLLSVGTDTGGSIRIPAALCGVVGLKPTFGRVSRDGLLPLAPSLDHAGPFTRSAEDAAWALAVLAGADPADSACADRPVPGARDALQAAAGLRVGALHPRPSEASPEVAEAFRRSLRVLADAGLEVRDVELPTQDETRGAAYVVLFAESAHTHRETLERGAAQLFPDIRERFERGRAIPAVDYIEALEARRRVARVVARTFEQVDVLLSPMVPVAAPPHGTDAVELGGEEVPVPAAMTTHTREWNLLGNPALSLPAGFDAQGLPLAVQVVGRHWEEATVLRVAHAYQQRTEWHRRRPPGPGAQRS